MGFRPRKRAVTIFDRSDRSRYQACSRAGKLIGVVDRLPDDR